MKILIVGDGKQAYFLTRDLVSKGHSVVLVCGGADDARWIARRVKATIVHGEGSDPRVLDDAGIHEVDALIASTPRDPDNLVICQIAERHFRVPLTLAVVHDPDNQEVFPRLGVKNVVSVTPLVSRAIEQRTVAEEVTNLAMMGEGAVNLTELVLPEQSPVIGKPISAAALPKDTLVASVVRGSEAIIPHGDTVLRAGDRIVLVTLPTSYGPAVKYLTGER